MVEGFKHQAKEYDCTLRVLETVLVEMWHKHKYMQERLIWGESRSGAEVMRPWAKGETLGTEKQVTAMKGMAKTCPLSPFSLSKCSLDHVCHLS